jgi:hypothetical protein
MRLALRAVAVLAAWLAVAVAFQFSDTGYSDVVPAPPRPLAFYLTAWPMILGVLAGLVWAFWPRRPQN